MEAEFRRVAPRRDIVRAAERGKEVVERSLVCQIDDCETQTPLVTISVEHVVIAHAGIKQVPRGNALRIVVVVFLTGSRYPDELRSELRG